MSNNKQSSSIDFFWNQLPEILPFTVDTETAVKLWGAFEQAKAMQQEQAQQYAEFCVQCDRESLPLLEFNTWIAHNETFNNEQTN